jgi:hypothetical protein
MVQFTVAAAILNSNQASAVTIKIFRKKYFDGRVVKVLD